ncbi:hypothetical protein C1645_826994 [Glomus cerebriforme]|uniref:Uncharacterized protein n=1 Tax=Glomus cerebriforme TaxID=658196 RepID=A0A397SVG7_9GLOM|nr:hypothetical protein C1645_826994 [Glomus cerebriforme]
MELIPKPEDTTMSLSQTNKPKKTLEEMRSLDRHHIVEYYREDRLTTATRAERHRICLELLRICTPARDIDDRSRYKADEAVDKSQRYYHLVSLFDSKDAPKFPSYQTGEEIYWENGKDTRYGYSKISPNELLLGNLSSSTKVDNTQISEDIQNLFDIYYEEDYTYSDNSEGVPSTPIFELTTNPQRGRDPYPHYPTQKLDLHRFWCHKNNMAKVATDFMEHHKWTSETPSSELAKYTEEINKSLKDDRKNAIPEKFTFLQKNRSGNVNVNPINTTIAEHGITSRKLRARYGI